MFIEYINQFWKGWCNIYIGFIFNAFDTLTQNFLCNKSCFFSILIIRLEIHEQCNKWGLTICSHQCIDLVLNGLNAILYLFTRTFPSDFASFLHIWFHAINLNLFFNYIVEDLFVRFTHERCQNTVDTINTLTTILTRCNLGNNLSGYCTCYLEGFWCINTLTINNCTICQHIF